MEAEHLRDPYFSIVIPCFNDGDFATQAIRSCVSQKFSLGVEIILVDDGSTDDSVAIVRREFADLRCLRVLTKENGGLSSARNHGIKNARGRWLIFLDADDMLAPRFLASAAAICDAAGVKPDLVVLPFRYFIGEDKMFFRRLRVGFLLAPRFNSCEAWNRFWIRTGNSLPVSALVVSRVLVNNLPGFDEQLKSHEDWDYWIRVIDSGASIRYARVDSNAATLIRLRQGMSAHHGRMTLTHRDVLLRHCDGRLSQWLRHSYVRFFFLGVRTVLGLLDACAGRRVNLTLP